MNRPALTAVGFLLLLLPSAWLAWNFRDVPHFGHIHDDGLNFIGAKSLAEGSGYRILSLPGEPYQTKYPPLYPALLSIVWKVNPAFPENLVLACALAWLAIPPYLFLSRRAFADLGLGAVVSWLGCALLAVNPYVGEYATSLMPELFFTCLLLASLHFSERAKDPTKMLMYAACAGLLGGAAFLTKTSAIALLATSPAYFLLRRQYSRAAVFAGAMLPAVLGWAWWSRAHLEPSSDPVMMYYTDYLQYHFYNVAWSDLPHAILTNIPWFLRSLGELLIFNTTQSGGGTFLAYLLAVGMIAGLIRSGQRTGATHYHYLVAGYTVLLVAWHYPPNERFVLPIFTLFLAGFLAEVQYIARRVVRTKQRALAIVLASLSFVFLGFGVYRSLIGTFQSRAEFLIAHRQLTQGFNKAFTWISGNLPEDSVFLAYEDPLLYLSTGVHGLRVPVPTRLLYSYDVAGIHRHLMSMHVLAQSRRLRYLFLTAEDYHNDLLPPGEQIAFLSQTKTGVKGFRLLYSTPEASVYQLEEDGSLPPRRVSP